jgi:hypothetical protein
MGNSDAGTAYTHTARVCTHTADEDDSMQGGGGASPHKLLEPETENRKQKPENRNTKPETLHPWGWRRLTAQAGPGVRALWNSDPGTALTYVAENDSQSGRCIYAYSQGRLIMTTVCRGAGAPQRRSWFGCIYIYMCVYIYMDR